MAEARAQAHDGPMLACDLGGTATKIAVVEAGAVVRRRELSANSDQPLAAHLETLVSALREIAAEAGREVSSLGGLSIAIPGLVDVANGRVLLINGKYEDAPSLDLVGWARDELGLRAVVENDARAALLGEWHHGAGRGCDNLVMLTLGTGIGVAAVVDGRVLRGPHGAAGILGGHLTVAIGGRACTCGRLGCAEAEASTWALPGLADDLSARIDTNRASNGSLDYRRVSERADDGDELCIQLIDRSIEVWSTLIVDLVHLYDPERVVLGGGIARNEDIVGRLKRALDEDPWSKDWRVPIEATQLGNDAALLAASSLLRSSAHHQSPEVVL